jgi:hypothetical protein
MTKIIRNSALVATFGFALILATSCSESSKGILDNWLGNLTGQLTQITSSNLLQNPQLGFMSNAPGIPDGDIDVIEDVEISGSVLSGGSVQLTVTSSQKLKELYLQIEGEEDGYYVWTLEPEDQISTNPYVYQVVLEFNRDLDGGDVDDPNELNFIVSGKTAKNEVVEQKEEKLKTIKAGNGALQISLSWDKNDDVDLHIFSPSGEHLYFGNRKFEAAKGYGKAELDIDSNAGCIIDGINSENIFFEAPLEDGDYKVEVRMYEKCRSISEDGAKYRVTANIQGKFIEFSSKQSGQFTNTNNDDDKIVVGTIKIREGEFSN